MIQLDTSVLVDALTGPRRSIQVLAGAVARGDRLGLSTLVLYEWLRGPRSETEISDQEALFPGRAAVPFGPREAIIAAELCRRVPRARQRERDLAIAAVAMAHDAFLWTLHLDDFRDVPGLRLYAPPS